MAGTMAAAPPAPPPQILVVDLIRFGCALLVMTYHYTATIAPAAFWFGFVGVEVFFVVSGYVIAASAGDGEAAAFLRRRLLRLAPAAWICATLTAAIVVAGAAPGRDAILPQWLASVVFWPLAPQVDPSYWTLGIELSFYLLVAALLDGRANVRRIERLGLVLATASAAFWTWHGVAMPQLNRGLDLLLLSHGGFFAAGIALHAARAAGWSVRRAATVLVGLAAGAAEIAATAADIGGGRGGDGGGPLPMAIVAAAVLALAVADRVQRPLERWVGARRLALMGLMTYPLYLIHQRAGEAVASSLVARGMAPGPALALAAALALATAWIVVRRGEPALRRRLAAISLRRGPARDIPRTASPPAG